MGFGGGETGGRDPGRAGKRIRGEEGREEGEQREEGQAYLEKKGGQEA